jgi:hypothetical protein
MSNLGHLAIWSVVSVLILVFAGSNIVFASSVNISRSYYASTNISTGNIVSLESSNSGYVQLANITNGPRLIGVVLPSNESLLAINPNTNDVQVAINGTVNVLATNVNGNIKVGDQVSVSPFSGLGMEAASADRVIGVAQSALNSTTPNAVTEHVKNSNGKINQLKEGYIKLTIAIGNGIGTGAGGSQTNILQKYIKSLTGRTISTIRIILSVIVTLISLISLITLIYAAIYGSIVSIGRNPLAKAVIIQTLVAVVIMSAITVAITCVTVFYLLR